MLPSKRGLKHNGNRCTHDTGLWSLHRSRLPEVQGRLRTSCRGVNQPKPGSSPYWLIPWPKTMNSKKPNGPDSEFLLGNLQETIDEKGRSISVT